MIKVMYNCWADCDNCPHGDVDCSSAKRKKEI